MTIDCTVKVMRVEACGVWCRSISADTGNIRCRQLHETLTDVLEKDLQTYVSESRSAQHAFKRDTHQALPPMF